MPNLNPHFNFHSYVFASSFGGPTSVLLCFYLDSLLMSNIIFTKVIKFKFAENFSPIYVVAAYCLMAGTQKFINKWVHKLRDPKLIPNNLTSRESTSDVRLTFLGNVTNATQGIRYLWCHHKKPNCSHGCPSVQREIPNDLNPERTILRT